MMKVNKKYIQTFVFVLVYLFGIYFWSQPYQERKLPYGEYDAMSHFEVADYMAYNDRSFIYLPPYIDLRYGNDNKFKPHTLWYPPTFHASLGVIEAVSGERALPVFLMNTILATFIIITIYFVVNSLFGFWPAILSSLLLIFSPRDFMPFLWGQWPERFAYAFIPLILYCFYKYFISYSKKENKSVYLYFTSLFLVINLLIHPLVFFHSIAGIAVLYLFLAIKQKKFVFNLKHLSIALIIFLVIFMVFPYQTLRIFPEFMGGPNDNSQEGLNFSRIFKWSFNPKDFVGSVPSIYFSFKDMHGLWTLPFLLLGILFLVLRRKERDLFLMAWLVSLYFVLHRDIIGKTNLLHRSLSATAHIFVPLTAVGAMYLGSFLRIHPNFKKYLKYAIIAVFLYFTFSVNAPYAKNFINKDTYNPYSQSGFFSALNHQEVEAAQWMLDNTPISTNISVLGIPYQDQLLDATSKKIRWFAAMSQHVTRFYQLREDKDATLREFYVLMDYTMLGPLNDRKTLEEMQTFEKTVLANHTLLYDKNNIRVYKYEN